MVGQGETVISGDLKLFKETLKVLKDKGDGKAGLGFNESSMLVVDAPEDGVLRFRGQPGKGAAPFVRLVVIGLNVVGDSVRHGFNPTWLWKHVKVGSIEDKFSLVISDEEKATIGFSSSAGHGYNVPLGKCKSFDLSKFLKIKLFDEDLHMRIPAIKYSLSMSSFRVCLERAAVIHPKYFAFYSIDGRLFMYVSAKGGEYLDPIGITGVSITKEVNIDGKTFVAEDKEAAMFDSYMPVSADHFDIATRLFDQLDITLPIKPDVVKTFTIDATRVVGKSAIEMTLASGRNIEFKDCPTVAQIRERIHTGGFEELPHSAQQNQIDGKEGA